MQDSEHYEYLRRTVREQIAAGALDQAATTSRELMAQYPDLIDGYSCLSEIYHLRGDNVAAIRYLREAAGVAQTSTRETAIPERILANARELEALLAQPKSLP